ncbi:hypothetical protein J2X54_002486 [Duganella sp. 3397]|uniref:transporter n=1 Tax=Duganella sp. 3397 TaxID=2817732 RepID=UPI0028579186|nr:transporter [Duganella sp. 3397]MDR7050031.1 hypothetical protein [Duganella sp. 3397]
MTIKNFATVPGLLSVLTALMLPMLPGSAIAGEDDDAIVTDRPDFVESSDVVGKGRFQIETSVAVERDKSNGFKLRTVSTPTLLRLGIAEDWELRVETDGRMRATADNQASGQRLRESGYADTAVGVKWHALDEEGARPSVGVLAHWELDTGSAPFRAPGKGGSLRVVAEWELPADMSLGVMPGVVRQRNDDGQRFTSGIFAVVLGKEWNDRLRTFVEYSAQQVAHARDGGSINTVDVGAAWLLSKSVQVDTAVARALNKNAPDWSWTVGLSLKF